MSRSTRSRATESSRTSAGWPTFGPAMRGHHERYDGKGYPDGLAGEAIPMPARILAVADACDAMMSARRYRHAPGAGADRGDLQRGLRHAVGRERRSMFLYLPQRALRGLSTRSGPIGLYRRGTRRRQWLTGRARLTCRCHEHPILNERPRNRPRWPARRVLQKNCQR